LPTIEPLAHEDAWRDHIVIVDSELCHARFGDHHRDGTGVSIRGYCMVRLLCWRSSSCSALTGRRSIQAQSPACALYVSRRCPPAQRVRSPAPVLPDGKAPPFRTFRSP